jgi:glycosyltransferase involved in cell wall biosynthesis
MILALQRAGVHINLSTSDGRKKKYKWFWKPIYRAHERDLVTIFCTPQTWHFPKYGYPIMFTTIEAKTIHSAARHRAGCFQELWVPSKFNQDVFKRYGFTNVHVIPEGIDPKFWNTSHQETDDTFKFICLADWSFRKGVHSLIKAFYLAFQGDKKVKLIFLTRKAAHEGRKYTREIMKEATDHVNDVGGNLDNVEFITTILTDEQIRWWFSVSDCFVLPTLGEAWCLPAEEAMACELPVILPKVGGQRHFTTKHTGWFTSGYWAEMPTSDVLFYNRQLFYHPHIKSLVRALRHARAHPQQCRQKGKYARQYVTSNFTWDDAAQIAVTRLEEIYRQGFTSTRRGICLG